MIIDMFTSTAYCCCTTLGRINSWFYDILADLIHQNAAKTIKKVKDEIHYFRPVRVKEKTTTNA